MKRVEWNLSARNQPIIVDTAIQFDIISYTLTGIINLIWIRYLFTADSIDVQYKFLYHQWDLNRDSPLRHLMLAQFWIVSIPNLMNEWMEIKNDMKTTSLLRSPSERLKTIDGQTVGIQLLILAGDQESRKKATSISYRVGHAMFMTYSATIIHIFIRYSNISYKYLCATN